MLNMMIPEVKPTGGLAASQHGRPRSKRWKSTARGMHWCTWPSQDVTHAFQCTIAASLHSYNTSIDVKCLWTGKPQQWPTQIIESVDVDVMHLLWRSCILHMNILSTTLISTGQRRAKSSKQVCCALK